MACRCCSTASRLLPALLAAALFMALLPGVCAAAATARGARTFPLEMDALMGALSDTRRPAPGTDEGFPRSVSYRFLNYNFVDDTLSEQTRTVLVQKKPLRIIPHAIGLTEILWAIAPRERIIAVHRSCRDRRFSFLAPLLPETLPTYGTDDAEIVIGHRPDLVLTSFYSNANFLHQLRTARVPQVQFGFFNDLESIKDQIRLTGRLIGEEASAERLITIVNEKVRAIQTAVQQRRGAGQRPPSVLYYDNMAYVAGAGTTFDAMCRVLGVTNVAATRGVRNFKQVDYETLLQWNPDMIIVPQESTFDEQLYSQPILASAAAVRHKNIRKMPSVYLLSASQYLVASINYLAGLLYDTP
jgi:iron complex transport system substrate-binding protein